MVDQISVVIIVKNGERTIGKTLESIQDFNDVVVYDNGSTDKTLSIAKNYSNVNLIKGSFSGFGPTKNIAATFAKNNWILSLDADEVIGNDFVNGLKEKHLNRQTIYQIFKNE